MLSIFFLAHVVVTVWLIHFLGIRSPVHQAIPWIFAAAFTVTSVPQVARRLHRGGVLWRALPALLYAGVISLASSTTAGISRAVSENPVHPVEFAALAFLGHYAAHAGLSPRLRGTRLLLVAGACVLFGAADELHQALVPGRDSSVVDWLLDALGVALGTGLFAALQRLSRRIGRPQP